MKTKISLGYVCSWSKLARRDHLCVFINVSKLDLMNPFTATNAIRWLAWSIVDHHQDEDDTESHLISSVHSVIIQEWSVVFFILQLYVYKENVCYRSWRVQRKSALERKRSKHFRVIINTDDTFHPSCSGVLWTQKLRTPVVGSRAIKSSHFLSLE